MAAKENNHHDVALGGALTLIVTAALAATTAGGIAAGEHIAAENSTPGHTTIINPGNLALVGPSICVGEAFLTVVLKLQLLKMVLQRLVGR